MKTALEWLNEVGESAGQDMFCGDPKKPGSRTETTIRRIQVDALLRAADIVNEARFEGVGDLRSIVSMIKAEAEELERHEI